MGNVSVKQRAYKNNKTMRHKRKNNTARNKRHVNKRRRRNKTRRGGAPSRLSHSVTNRDGKAVTNNETHYTASKQSVHPPSFKSKKKTHKKKGIETPAKYVKNMQKDRVGEPGGIVYSVKSKVEQNVFPVVNKVASYLGSKSI